MKTRILFIVPNFEHGGTNKALENLIGLLDRNKFECFVVSTSPQSTGYYSTIFKDIILSFPAWFQYFLSNTFMTRLQFFLLRYFGIFTWFPIYRIVMRQMKSHYSIDTVIAFQETMPSYVGAGFSGNSIAWVHCDYHEYAKNRRYKEEQVYKYYSNIVCVSSQSRKGFVSSYPKYEGKTLSIHNTLDVAKIVNESDCKVDDDSFSSDSFTIISIGRFCAEKQFVLIPDIVKCILDIAPMIKFKWFVIGGGNAELMSITRRKIKEYALENYLSLLGMKDNPYCYLKQSDLLVSTSSTESCPYVVNEAKILHIPVVSNNYPSAYELIDENCGIIVSIDEMPNTLISLIGNTDSTYDLLKAKCNNTEYSNDSILKQIEGLILKVK